MTDQVSISRKLSQAELGIAFLPLWEVLVTTQEWILVVPYLPKYQLMYHAQFLKKYSSMQR